MNKDGDISGIGTLDQAQFDYLIEFTILKGRNAQQVYQEMEWE